MKDDRFTNLEKDIIRTIGRVLSSQEISDLKNTIYNAMDQVEKATQKTAKKLQDLGEDASKKQTYPKYQPYQQTNSSAYSSGRQYTNHSPKSYSHNYPTPYRNLKIRGKSGTALWLTFSILGIVLGTCTALIGTLASLIIDAAFVAGSLISGGILTAASIVSTVLAGKSLSKFDRFKKYLKVLDNQPMYTVKEIAEKSSYSEAQVSKDLPRFVSAVSFPFAKLDDQATCLILEKETYQQYLELKENHRRMELEEAERQARLAADPHAAAIAEMKQNGVEYLHKIRMVNDALPEEAISNKLDQLELICRKIFDYVEKHPNKLPQIRKLMSYYLPMTLKLVEAYEQLEAHRVQSASIEESKAEIHSALDNIILAFENLFDRLLENERMDLSADISVLETMLAQEGLTDPRNNINSK